MIEITLESGGFFRQIFPFVTGELIQINDLWTMKPARAHDAIFMDVFQRKCTLSEGNLEHLNLMCLWLCVLTLADITDPVGRFVETWTRNGLM